MADQTQQADGQQTQQNLTFDLGTIASAFGAKQEELEAIFKDEAGNYVADAPVKFREFVTKDRVTNQDTARRDGIRARMLEIEETIRKEFGITDKSELLPLVKAVVAREKSEAEKLKAELEGKKGTTKSLKDIAPDDAEGINFALNHPIFQQKIKEYQDQANTAKTEFEQFRERIEAEKTRVMVERLALQYLNEYNPVVDEDGNRALSHQKGFISDIFSRVGKFEFDGDAIKEMYDAKGEKIKDQDHIFINFEQLVKKVVAPSWYKSHPANPNVGTPNTTGRDAAASAAGVVIPEWSKLNDQQRDDYIRAESDYLKRLELAKSLDRFMQTR